MPTITAVTPSARRNERYEIFVDGVLFVTVGATIIGDRKLWVHSELDEETMATLQKEELVLATIDRAMNMLSFRSRATKELAQKLKQKGEAPEQITEALARLTKAGFLDDANYARQFTRSKISSSGFGSRRVSFELSMRGVARDVASAAIAEVKEHDQVIEGEVLEKVAVKKLRSLARYEPEVQKRRLYGFLARRGFSGEDIGKAMKKLFRSK
jgi:regulatory protein